MNTIIDPTTIGESRGAWRIKAGWHMIHDGRDALALSDAIVGQYAAVNVRYSDGRTESAIWPRDQQVWTRRPEEQVQYIAARAAHLLADEGLEKQTLSGAAVPPCGRDDCKEALAVALAENVRLLAVLDALRGSRAPGVVR